MRELDELAVFPDIRRVSVGFAFDVSEFRERASATPEPRSKRSAFRLLKLSKRLELEAEAFKKRLGEDNTVHGRLIEPVRSFLDDVTNGPPGINGRPLLMLASGADENDQNRIVRLHRPATWDYEFEGETTILSTTRPDGHGEEGAKGIELRLRDSFCVFESGRIYYVLHLVQPGPDEETDDSEPQPDDAAPLLDEYGILQLQQLGMESERAGRADYLAFEWNDEKLSLLEFANARLGALCQLSAGRPLHAVTDFLRPNKLLRSHEPLSVDAADLVGMCIGIEDERVQRTADYVFRRLDAKRGKDDPERPPEVVECDAAWEKKCTANVPIHYDPKNSIGKPSTGESAADRTKLGRTALALAGLATGVPDFPFQDESEVHDSTRSTAQSVESALFTHPQFQLEVGRNWRSFREALDALGNCPYLYLTWMVTIHDEMTVAAMEHELESLIYDPDGEAAKLEWEEGRALSSPLTDVVELLNSASKLLGQDADVLERNLRQRLEIFRWEAIHRCGNMFRYPKETAALAAVREAKGTNRRFEEVHSTLDRLESLVEDVSTLASAYSERRTNRLLIIIALLGLISVPKGIDDLAAVWNGGSGWLNVAATLAGLGLLTIYVIRVGPRRMRRD